MATEKKPLRKQDVNYVPVTIPRGAPNDDPNVMVGINGINYVLPKGKTSMVPDFVAEEIRRSEYAKEIQDRNMDALLEAAQSQQ